MRLKYFNFLMAVAAVMICFVSNVNAATQEPMTKDDIEVIIHDYIMENPKVFMDALVKYQTEQATVQQELDMDQYGEEIFNAPHSPVIGNPKGDVTVVEFTDYNCGYCKRSAEVIAELIKRDKNVRVVLKEYPVLGATSKTAAKWAFAAHKQGKYFKFHMALMKVRTPIDRAVLNDAALAVGLDVFKMRKDADSKEAEEFVKRDKKLGKGLGLAGTPVFIVGDTINPGAMPLDEIEKEIARQRAKK